MLDFMSGLIAMGFAVAGLLFMRSWIRTRDTLFLIFATAFWLMALNQTLLSATNPKGEALGFICLLRLGAFVLIIIGIVVKNAERRLQNER